MRLPTVSFFATAEDLRPIIVAVESRYDIRYLECGLFDEEHRVIIPSLNTLASLSCASLGESNREPTYLVIPAGVAVNIRPVPQRRGGVKYAIDQMANPGTIVLRPGGKHHESVVIAGMVGSVKHDPEANKLLKAFSTEIKLLFTEIKGCWVGPTALRLHKAGARLTNAVTSPDEYDLIDLINAS